MRGPIRARVGCGVSENLLEPIGQVLARRSLLREFFRRIKRRNRRMNRHVGGVRGVKTFAQRSANVAHRPGEIFLQGQPVRLDPLIFRILGPTCALDVLAHVALMLVQVGDIQICRG